MRRPGVQGPIVWLLAMALIAQSWLGQLATAAIPAELNTIVICTGSGFKVIRLPEGSGPLGGLGQAVDLGQEDEPDHRGRQDHQRLDCTACLAKAAAKAFTTPALEPDLRLWPETRKADLAEPSFRTLLLEDAPSNRGPPGQAS